MGDDGAQTPVTVFTIGHSNHEMETFLWLLNEHGIHLLIDVRSSPRSAYSRQFNREVLEHHLPDCGFEYEYLGRQVGGRPDNEEFYDAAGHVLYDRVAASKPFQEGIAHIIEAAQNRTTAIFCSEENPTDCHRRLLIGRVLLTHGVDLLHIRGDGRIESEAEVAREEELNKTGGQLNLFEEPEAPAWKSTQSVLPKSAPRSSLNLFDRPPFDA